MSVTRGWPGYRNLIAAAAMRKRYALRTRETLLHVRLFDVNRPTKEMPMRTLAATCRLAVLFTLAAGAASAATAPQSAAPICSETTPVIVSGTTPPPLFLSYEGGCGGWVRDADQALLCCRNTDRPKCDDDGTCRCEWDRYCVDICSPLRNCDQKNDCPDDDED